MHRRVCALSVVLLPLFGCNTKHEDIEGPDVHIPTIAEDGGVANAYFITGYYKSYVTSYRIDPSILIRTRSTGYHETWIGPPVQRLNTGEAGKFLVRQRKSATKDNRSAGPRLVLLDSVETIGDTVYVTGYMEGDWFVLDKSGVPTEVIKPFHARFKATWEEDNLGLYRLVSTNYGPEGVLSPDEMKVLKNRDTTFVATKPL